MNFTKLSIAIVAMVIVLFAAYSIYIKYFEKVALKKSSAILAKLDLQNSHRRIAQESSSVAAALNMLHPSGATGIEAVFAISVGRGLSVADAKSAVIGFTKWKADEDAIKKYSLGVLKLGSDQ